MVELLLADDTQRPVRIVVEVHELRAVFNTVLQLGSLVNHIVAQLFWIVLVLITVEEFA